LGCVRKYPPLAKYLAARRGKPTPVYLPYVMDVWDGGKVLSLQWADDGFVEIISYKPGTWEDLERHAAAASQAASVPQKWRPLQIPWRGWYDIL
jgi:hypothetical protein